MNSNTNKNLKNDVNEKPIGPKPQLFRSEFLLDNKRKLKKSHLRFLTNIFTVCCNTFGTNYIKIIENIISSTRNMDNFILRGLEIF